VVFKRKRTEVIEWKYAGCNAILNSKYDKLEEEYNKRRKRLKFQPCSSD